MMHPKEFKQGTRAALAIALMLFGSAASAATILADNNGRIGGNASGTVPTGTGTETGSGGGGLFQFVQDASTPTPDLLPAGNQFVAFCIEFNETLQGGNATYAIVDLKDAPINAEGALPTGMGSVKAGLIATLIGNVFGLAGPPAFVNNAANQTLFSAVQLAIWEIVHETDTVLGNLVLNVNSGAAAWTAADNNALINAQAYLTAIGGWTQYTAAQVGLKGLVNQNTGARQQDFLVWDKDPSQEVPLPAAAWLLLSGLAGLGVVARRRKTA